MSDTKDTNTAQQGGTAPEPERTFTQSELDAIIGDRLKREREKYSDYEAIKAKADKYDEAEEANKSELQKAVEKADSLQKQLDALNKQNDIREVRAKVAKEKNVPADLLTGDDEESCTAQADAILDFAKPSGGYPQAKDAGEAPLPSGGGKTRDQFADWLSKSIGSMEGE